MGTLWNHAVLKALILTGNHWGIAVLLFVAVFVGAETLHEAQVALSQELVRKSKDENIKKWSIKAEEAPLMMTEMQQKHIDSPDAKQIGVEANARHVTDVRGVLQSAWPLTPGRSSHPELLLQLRAACWVGSEDAVDVTVQLGGGHLCLPPQNVFHQSVVDENILLLQTQTEVVPETL